MSSCQSLYQPTLANGAYSIPVAVNAIIVHVIIANITQFCFPICIMQRFLKSCQCDQNCHLAALRSFIANRSAISGAKRFLQHL